MIEHFALLDDDGQPVIEASGNEVGAALSLLSGAASCNDLHLNALNGDFDVLSGNDLI